MKPAILTLTVLVVLFVMSGCATVQEGKQDDGSAVVRLTPEQVQQCAEQGGCDVVSQMFLWALVQRMCGKGL